MPAQLTIAAFQTEVSAGAAVPEWVQLLPNGETVARDGRKFILANAKAVISTFQAGGIDLPIDYEHQVDKQGHNGPIPAAGWIKELAERADGLWGRVAWTDRATKLISAKEYRFLSPTEMVDKETKEVVMIKGAGLVHRPALHLTALASEEEADMDPPDFMNEVADLLGMAGETDPQAILDAIKAAIAGDGDGAPDPAKYLPIEAVQDLLKDRNKGAAEMTKQTASLKVEDAVRKGILTPAMRGWATERCMQDAASFDRFVTQSAPVFGHLTETFDYMNDAPAPFPRPQSGADSGDAAKVCAQLGLASDALN